MEPRENIGRYKVYDAANDVTLVRGQPLFIQNTAKAITAASGQSASDIYVGLCTENIKVEQGATHYVQSILNAVIRKTSDDFNADGSNTGGAISDNLYWDPADEALTLDADSGSNKCIGTIEYVVTAADKDYKVRLVSDVLILKSSTNVIAGDLYLTDDLFVADEISMKSPTAAKGKLKLYASDSAGDTDTIITNDSHGQQTIVKIPDSGLANSYIAQSTAALTVAEVDVLDGAAAGTQAASKAVIPDANVNTGVSKVTELHIGATGAEEQVTSDVEEINQVVNFPGNMAMGSIDFNNTGNPAMTIEIDGVVYAEQDAVDYPNGKWTNGASAADSASSLILAINGDTRATVPFTASADDSGDGVILTWDNVGDAGNVVIASDHGTATVDSPSVLGEDAGTKKVTNLAFTVTTNLLLAGVMVIPIPFTPTGFTFSCVDSSGTPIYTTDKFLIDGDTITIDTDGVTNLADTDIVYLTVWE